MKISFNNPDLLIPISDLVSSTTIIKRKARFNYLTHHPILQYLKISVQIIPFAANEDGTYGQQFDEALIKSYEKTFTAIMGENLVDVTTGLYICDSNKEYLPQVDENNNAVLDENNNPVMTLNPLLEGKNYAEEFDFYNNLAATSPVIINNLISGFVAFADSKGRFNRA